jgi:predicted RNA binding protein YcfA (HicA-like mRNA interferase family)
MIDYSRLRSVTARQLDGALLADGFVFRRQTGSHRRYAHPDGRRVTLTVHHWSDTGNASEHDRTPGAVDRRASPASRSPSVAREAHNNLVSLSFRP